jgi:hypothetical protein
MHIILYFPIQIEGGWSSRASSRAHAKSTDHNDRDFGNKNFEEKRKHNKVFGYARPFAKDHNDQDFGNKNFEDINDDDFAQFGEDVAAIRDSGAEVLVRVHCLSFPMIIANFF